MPMKRILVNSKMTRPYLESLTIIYMVGRWAHWGVREFKFSGAYDKSKEYPLVWDYDDCNGTCDRWVLRRIDCTTTGTVICWTFSKVAANRIAGALEKTER